MITTVLWRGLFLSWPSRTPPRPADMAAVAPYLSTARRLGRSIMASSKIQGPDTRHFFGGLISGPKLNQNFPFDFLFGRHVTRTRVRMQCNTPARAVIA